jgi:hypothetical protein
MRDVGMDGEIVKFQSFIASAHAKHLSPSVSGMLVAVACVLLLHHDLSAPQECKNLVLNANLHVR